MEHVHQIAPKPRLAPRAVDAQTRDRELERIVRILARQAAREHVAAALQPPGERP